MGSGLPGSPPSYLLLHLLLYMSYLANKIVVVVVHSVSCNCVFSAFIGESTSVRHHARQNNYNSYFVMGVILSWYTGETIKTSSEGTEWKTERRTASWK